MKPRLIVMQRTEWFAALVTVALLVLITGCGPSGDGVDDGEPNGAGSAEPTPTETEEAEGPGVVSQSAPEGAAGQAEEYWTEERLNAAEPFPPPEPSPEEHERLTGAPAPEEAEAQTIEPSPPADGEEGEAAAGEADVQGTPARADVGERPFWNGGKLFFQHPDGAGYYCTAEFVGSKRVLMTAAHCVTDGNGNWYKNFSFRRAYDDGGGQSVGWECMAVYNGYFNGRDFAFDYAFIYTNTDSGAGWLGFKTGIPYGSWWSIGYPAAYSGGNYMYKVEGTKGTVTSRVVEMQGNPMEGGSSGGAWIGDLTTPHVGGNYAIGLNSYHTTSTNEFGPYFNTDTYNLLTFAMNKECMN